MVGQQELETLERQLLVCARYGPDEWQAAMDKQLADITFERDKEWNHALWVAKPESEMHTAWARHLSGEDRVQQLEIVVLATDLNQRLKVSRCQHCTRQSKHPPAQGRRGEISLKIGL
jgi:hypothetical protein